MSAVAALVLVLTFGSLVAAGMTLLNALVGVAAGMAGLFALSSTVELTSTAPILALMLGLAVGIDYALFITSRYRHYLPEGMDGEEAAGRAAGTAGSAVVFAGATVVIALAGLAVAGVPFLTVMGLAAAATVALAVLVSLTLLPAVLGFAGAACPAPQAADRGTGRPPRLPPRPAGRLRLPLGPDRGPAARPRPPPRRGRPRRPRPAGAGHAAGAARREHRGERFARTARPTT